MHIQLLPTAGNLFVLLWYRAWQVHQVHQVVVTSRGVSPFSGD